MKTSTKIFIFSSAISFLFISVGTVLLFSLANGGGEVTASGSAPGEINFEASAFQYYDIYADDSDISIELGDFRYDASETYVDMCSVLGSDNVTGITGDCGQKRGEQVLVGSITIGFEDEGQAVLLLDGTGDVTIVQQSVTETGGIIGLLCVGCCFGPIIVLLSGLQSMKAVPTNNVYLVEQTLPSTPPSTYEQEHSARKAENTALSEIQNSTPEISQEPKQKTKSFWDEN